MKPFILIILDGWGWSKEKTGNSVLAAQTPALDEIRRNYPFFLLQASGPSVGLPPLKEGNSEVGHLTIGAGRIVPQHLTLINNSLKDGSFFKNEKFKKLIAHTGKNNSKLHLIGLLTSGTVHASLEHLLTILKYLLGPISPIGPTKVLLHLFTDGKDSGKKESLTLLQKIEELIGPIGPVQITSLIGRDFAMDREENWRQTEKAYNLLVKGEGNKAADLKEALRNYHAQGISDELIPPTILTNDQRPTTNDYLIEDGDGVLFFNFREDSARQLTRAFVDKNFNHFETKKFNDLFFVTMTDYRNNVKTETIFEMGEIKNTLGEFFQNNNLSQLHLAEKVKKDHITYFFNGLRERPFENEEDLILGPTKNPEENPQMQGPGIGEKIIEEIKNGKFDFIVANFANADILSHTGNFNAAVKGIEIVDESINKIYEAVKEKGLTIIITADHGNAENLTYLGSGEKETRHNVNPVPFYLISEKFKKGKSSQDMEKEEKEIKGLLTDIAPTILELMGMEKPPEMKGISLINYIKG